MSRRYQKIVERRRRQRAHCRDAIAAARGARETSDQDSDRPSETTTKKIRSSHQSARNLRRSQRRRLVKRSQESRQIVDKLVACVTQLSETTPHEVQGLLRRDWQRATTSEADCAAGTTIQPTGQPTTSWCAVHQKDEPARPSRGQDDGVLLTVPARVYGKKVTALVDSGATRSFISPGAVLKCGLRAVHQETVLELADGRKLLSHGVCPHVLISVATAMSKLDLTVSPLLQNVDVILGANWLQMTEPLIDWSVPRLLLPGSDTAATVIGKWLSKEVPVGQISILHNFCLPSRPVPPSLQIGRAHV